MAKSNGKLFISCKAVINGINLPKGNEGKL